MHSSLESLKFTVPLTAKNRSQAQTLASQMPFPDKAKEAERNLLAVLATQYYLQLLGFDSRASEDVLQHWLGNTIELHLPNGSLNCCPVRSDESSIILPNIQAALGHVVVQLSDDHRQATLLGFAPATAQHLSLQALQPLDVLVERLTETPLVHLQNWIENQTTAAWATLSELMPPDRAPHIVMAPVTDADNQSSTQQRLQRMIEELYEQTGIPPATEEPITNLSQLIYQLQDEELRWRAAELLWELDPDHPSSPIIRAKDLGLYLSGHAIALLVGLLPKPNNQALVLLRVYSIGTSPVLPNGIQFTGQDVDGKPIFDLVSRHKDDYIQFKFTADAGDRFSLTVQLEDGQVTESFLV